MKGMPMKLLSFALSALVLTAVQSSANEFEPAMQSYLEGEIKSWAQSDVLLSAIKAQNGTTAGYGEAQILEMDQAWRAEVGSSDTPTISPVLENAAAEFLRSQVEASGGVVTEVFIMDSVGLNVAASAVTSDMWQGDEAKFQKTHGAGADAVHFGEVEFDESTQTYQGQISMTITDPATGEPIGAMTVGVNAEALL